MQIHVVSPGQTLYAIGRQYGIAPGFIARYNGLREPYRLAVGQALLILRPEQAVTVQTGDTLFSVAQAAGVNPLEILRMNPNLGGQARLFPGQVLVTRLEQNRTRPVEVNGYAYPYVNVPTLRGILPFASDLTPFTYGFTAQGTLVGMDDEPLIALARLYGVRPLMHLSTLTESGAFSAERAAQLFADPQAEQALIGNTVAQMLARGYGGVDVDFEFLGAALAESYASFVGRLRAAVNAAGGELIAALAPKVSATQPGVLYEGHDYAAIAANADAVLLMTYEWGYTYGPPMAVAPVASVRRVLDYAVTQIPPEKIFMGFPNYAYDWQLPFHAGETRAQLIGNEAAPLLAAETGAQIQFDEVSQTPYFNYTLSDGTVHEVWFEDARSSLAKFSLVEEYGFRGLGYWNFMRPFTANFSLLNYLYSILTPGA